MDFRVAVAIAAAAVVAWVLLARSGNVSGAEARRLVAEGARLVDVRTKEEFAGGHIEGAVNIPVHEIAQRLGEFGPKDRPVVLYCRSGRRSASAARVLEKAGFTALHDLGGIGNW